MDLTGKVAVVTGGAGGIGQSFCARLAREGVTAIGIVDLSEEVACVCEAVNASVDRTVAFPFSGDVTDAAFRESVFADLETRFDSVNLCVPAAGILRDGLSVKVRGTEGPPELNLYDEDVFSRVIEVNLTAAVYWALRTIGSVAKARARRGAGPWTAEEPIEGAVVLVGSVSAAGNRGQVSYAASKAGLNGAASTLATEAIYYGMRCALLHPGFTDTSMARSVGARRLAKDILPRTQLQRLIHPDEIADAICFLLKNEAARGPLWIDAGWQPSPR